MVTRASEDPPRGRFGRPLFVLGALLYALCAGLVAVGCRGDGPDEVGPGAPNASASAAATPLGANARRPARHYYMARTKERCEVYSIEADVITPITTAPCPPSIEIGERIRLAGRTCMREGSPAREQPVVCPDVLTGAELHDRETRR